MQGLGLRVRRGSCCSKGPCGLRGLMLWRLVLVSLLFQLRLIHGDGTVEKGRSMFLVVC